MKRRLFLILPLIILFQSGSALPGKNSTIFKTNDGHVIKVLNGQIIYDNKFLLKIKYSDDILYKSNANRLIEDHGAMFLFIAMVGNPNLDRMNVYLVTSIKATMITDAILSAVKDYDNDGYLEFGGHDLTEGYNKPDSMYYTPTNYFEIRDGKIQSDSALIKSEDIKINGLYLPPNKQLDKDGNCCTVIPVLKKKHQLNHNN